MQEGLELLSHLEPEDLNWIFDTGIEQQIISNTVVIQEDTVPDSLFFLLEGLLGVSVSSMADQHIARLGPGEVIGEISFLFDKPATASVTAIENSLLLAVPWADLRKKVSEDTAFAANFYRAVALEAATRLQNSVVTLGHRQNQQQLTGEAANETWSGLTQHIEKLKEVFQAADHGAMKNDGEIPEEMKATIRQGFRQFAQILNDTIGDEAPGNEFVKAEVGRRVQREVLPYLLLTNISERMYTKPRGYAGDFFTIEMMYRGIDYHDPNSHRLGVLFDECFLKEPAAAAVCNRRGLLAEEITKIMAANEDKTTKVTSMACGPAAELFDVFEKLEKPTSLKATLIDIDLQALAYVGDKRDKLKLTRQMNMVNGNLVYLATGRQQVVLKDQDLAYSIGLIDYFNDKFVLMLLNYVYELLKPGGKVILGNFHPRNPSKALMDHVLDWKLIHRDEDDMNRLFRTSKFGRDCTEIRFEDQNVNLFAMCIKE